MQWIQQHIFSGCQPRRSRSSHHTEGTAEETTQGNWRKGRSAAQTRPNRFSTQYEHEYVHQKPCQALGADYPFYVGLCPSSLDPAARSDVRKHSTASEHRKFSLKRCATLIRQCRMPFVPTTLSDATGTRPSTIQMRLTKWRLIRRRWLKDSGGASSIREHWNKRYHPPKRLMLLKTFWVQSAGVTHRSSNI
jgi:hypothetical protein